FHAYRPVLHLYLSVIFPRRVPSFIFLFYSSRDHRDLHSFPTRRSSDLLYGNLQAAEQDRAISPAAAGTRKIVLATAIAETSLTIDRKSTRLNSSHVSISYAVFCLKKKTRSH